MLALLQLTLPQAGLATLSAGSRALHRPSPPRLTTETLPRCAGFALAAPARRTHQPPPPPMAKRPRRSYSLESRVRRLILSDAGLAVPGSSADDVAHAIRSRHREYQRYKLDLFASVGLRAISSLPPPGDASYSDDSAFGSSGRRNSHDATSSSTTTHSHSPPSSEIAAALLLLLPNIQMNPGVDQQLETEAAAEKATLRTDAQRGHGERKRVMFADLRGMASVIERLMLEVVVPLCHPELPLHLGVRPVAGILLHGPPGYGKTTLAKAIADETGVPFYDISVGDMP